MFFVSTVLGEKSSEVDQSLVASAKFPGRCPPPHWTGRGPVKKRIMFGELSGCCFLVCFLPGYVGVFVAHFLICFLLEVS